MDTDFYNKLDKIEITDTKYEIYNIRVGDDYENALNTILKHGFTKQKEGFSGYWKYNMYIIIEKNDNKVGSITIGVNDRVTSKRVY